MKHLEVKQTPGIDSEGSKTPSKTQNMTKLNNRKFFDFSPWHAPQKKPAWVDFSQKSTLNRKNNLTNEILGSKYPNVDTHHASVCLISKFNNFTPPWAQNGPKWARLSRFDPKINFES